MKNLTIPRGEEKHLLLLDEAQSLHIRLEAEAKLTLHVLYLNSEQIENRFQIELDGEQAEVHFYGLVIGGGRQHIENDTLIRHNVPNCRSTQLFKYLLDNEAIGAFRGKIIVAPDAQKTEAFQSNRNLLGSPDCRMFAQPQLEIYADDVKCSHGMSTGQLDESALFYMRSRGIPAAEAALLLKIAFANEIIESIADETLRTDLRQQIEKRLKGNE
jgi:Fe-S cluster assembly protein SufD